MKELSVEEKAKRYDEALEMAKKLIENEETNVPVFYVNNIKDIFPELKESEDERIKQELIEYHKTQAFLDGKPNNKHVKFVAWLEKQGNTNEPINRNEFAQSVLKGAAINLITWIDYNAAEGNMCLSNMECKDIEDSLVSGNWDKIYAYIKKKFEKQGEQKLTDVEEVNFFDDFRKTDSEVEPKFKKGDWVIIDGETLHITNVTEDGYSTEDGGHIPFRCEKDARLWTINDAKDGDALCSGQIILLFKKWEEDNDWNFVIAYAGIDISGKLQITNGHWLISNSTQPATKEQCDQLERAMTNAGYRWNKEELKLEKI